MAKLIEEKPNRRKVWEYTIPAQIKRYETWECPKCERNNIIHEDSVMVCVCEYN